MSKATDRTKIDWEVRPNRAGAVFTPASPLPEEALFDEAGIANHVWSFEEIVVLTDAKQMKLAA